MPKKILDNTLKVGIDLPTDIPKGKYCNMKSQKMYEQASNISTLVMILSIFMVVGVILFYVLQYIRFPLWLNILSVILTVGSSLSLILFNYYKNRCNTGEQTPLML